MAWILLEQAIVLKDDLTISQVLSRFSFPPLPLRVTRGFDNDKVAEASIGLLHFWDIHLP